MTESGYGTQYGELYGSTQSTNPEEPIMTNQATLQANDSLLLQGSTLIATKQTADFALYLHKFPDGTVELIQETEEGYVQISLKAEGIDLLKEVLV